MEFATIEGARANGLDGKIGTLTPGKEADLIMLRTDRINVLPINDPIGVVVRGMDSSNVDSVFIAGKGPQAQRAAARRRSGPRAANWPTHRATTWWQKANFTLPAI